MIKFIKNSAAVFLRDIKTLVIGDLHIGYEIELWKSGISVPFQTKIFLEDIKLLIERTKAERIVLNGDIKHKIASFYPKEKKMIKEFLENLQKIVKVEIVHGNHDGGIEKITKIPIYSSKGFSIGKYGFFHGHAWPSPNLMKCDWLIMNHLHPAVYLRIDGIKKVERVFVVSKLNKEKIKEKYRIEKTGKLKILILPTFNNFIRGIDIFSEESRSLSPIVRKPFFDQEEAKIYTINGNFLGNWKKIKKLRKLLS